LLTWLLPGFPLLTWLLPGFPLLFPGFPGLSAAEAEPPTIRAKLTAAASVTVPTKFFLNLIPLPRPPGR
jgi:hypothetical protein